MTVDYFLTNGRDSFQLFVGVFDTCLVWYLLELPSETQAVTTMTSLRAIDGDISYHSRESFSLSGEPRGKTGKAKLDGWMIVSRFREYETRSCAPSVRLFYLANMSLSHRKMESLIGHTRTLALTQSTVAGWRNQEALKYTSLSANVGKGYLFSNSVLLYAKGEMMSST